MLAGFLCAIKARGQKYRITCCLPHNLDSMRLRFPEIEWFLMNPGVREALIANADVWLGLGDTPFQSHAGTWLLDHIVEDLAICNRYGTPVYFLGVGAEGPEACRLPQTGRVLEQAQHLWTRDQQSATLLGHAAGGLDRITSAADLAHIYFDSLPAPADGPLPGSVGLVIHVERTEQLNVAELARFLSLHQGSQIRWIAQEVRSLQVSEVCLWEKFAPGLRARLVPAIPDYQKGSLESFLALYSRLPVLLSTRYHSALAAAWRGIAVSVYARSQKLDGFVRQFGCATCESLTTAEKIAEGLARAKPINSAALRAAAQTAQTACDDFFREIAELRPARKISIANLGAPRSEGAMAAHPRRELDAAGLAPHREADNGNNVKRILWVRTDSIGDAVLASAMLEPLRQKYPRAKLAVLCQQHVANLYTACPLVDSIICYELATLGQATVCAQIVAEITAFNPDLILNSTRSRDRLADELTLKFGPARHIALESDLNNISVADRDLNRGRYQRLIPSAEAPMTELARHADFLRGLGITVDALKPVIWTGPQEEALAEAYFQQQKLDSARTIAVFPGAQRQVRVYDGYAKALQGLEGFRFLVFGVAGEDSLAQALEQQLPGRTLNLCGRTTLLETAALLRRCRLYVGAESGGAHMACAVGVPNVVVLGGGHFGRFMPYSPLTSAVTLPLDCFGCNWRCQYASAYCLTSLLPEVLGQAIAAALNRRCEKPALFAQMDSQAVPGCGLPPALARLTPEAIEFVPVPVSQSVSAPLPTAPCGGPADTIRRLIFMLDHGDETARKLGIQLRIMVRQYTGLEDYSHQRTGAAEAAAAALLNQLTPRQLQLIPPLAELDGLMALALGVAAEMRKDWHNARACYSHALIKSPGAILGFRLALRLARMAASDGDAGMAESLRQQIVPKLRGLLLKTHDVVVEENAVLNWPANVLDANAATSRKQTLTPAPVTRAPLVTAIVSTYKSERFLRGCLEDLEAQTLADQLEIIVVDSHSPQNERAIVEEFQQRYTNIVYIRTQERETVYGAWNRGARAARGKYLTNANTDDRHRADALEILARTLEEHPEVALAYADCLITEQENETFDTGNPIGCYRWLEFNARDLWSRGCFAGPQPMWRREVHDEHGYFDPQMITAGDYEFWLRLAQTRKFLHVRQMLGLYLKSPSSVEHVNREIGAKEVELARERYRDSIMAGQPPFRPQLPEPTAPVEIMIGRECQLCPTQPAAPPAMLTVASLGRLDEARELFARRELPAAWASACSAMAKRPFHPEALMLLAQIARAAGAGPSAKLCAQRARDLAPGWQSPRNFLPQPRKGNAKPDWLVLPGQIENRKSGIGNNLSVCLIARNEERFLGQCLQSVRGLATQIVVVDTGSTDRTMEIAREFGAEIYSFAWCDDFAAARNAALEHATGNWILMLDADEELPAAQHARLQADMKNASAIASRLPLINAGQEKEGRSFVPRLFRNLPGAYYTGRIHEQVFPSLLPCAEKWGLKTELGTAEILHHGYTKELVRDRHKVVRNLKLLRAAIRETPADLNLVMNLGLELVRSDDVPGGLEKYRAAYELLSRQPPGERVPELREVLLTQFTAVLLKIRNYDEVVRVLTSPVARDGGLTASLHFALGLAQFERKQFGEAADHLRQCLAKRHQPGLTPINTDIHTAAPAHCLALALIALGDRTAAEKAFLAALAETSRIEAARLDYARFLHNEKRPVEALQQLHVVITTEPRNLVAWRLGGEITLGQAELLAFGREWTEEAARALPEDSVLAGQCAEALLLNGDTAGALEHWNQIWSRDRSPRSLAALILCEAVESPTTHAPDEGADEQAASRAFIEWYQRLIAVQANLLIGKINEQLDKLSRALPTAAQMLEAALAQTAYCAP